MSRTRPSSLPKAGFSSASSSSGGAGDFVPRHDLGLDPRRRAGRADGGLGVDADAVADGELDVAAVEHRREPLFEVVVRADGAPLAEDRPVAGAGDDELRLEDVGLFLGAALLLGVDEEERDGEVAVPPADLALDGDVGEQGVGGRRPDRAVGQRDFDDAAPGIPLPDPQRVAPVVLPVVPLLPPVLPPGGGYPDGRLAVIDAEGQAEGGRQERLGHRDLGVSGAVVGRVAAPLREFVGDQGGVLVLVVLRRGPGGSGSGPAGDSTPTR
jgi:hypothetical protein